MGAEGGEPTVGQRAKQSPTSVTPASKGMARVTVSYAEDWENQTAILRKKMKVILLQIILPDVQLWTNAERRFGWQFGNLLK